MLFLFQCPVRCENKELILTVSLICVNFLFSQDVLLASRGLLRSYFVSEKEIKVHQERLFADEKLCYDFKNIDFQFSFME